MAALLQNISSMIAKLPQHNCQSSAALLHTLCSIAAEVVQDSCLNCAAMLHNLCQAAAEILALWFCDLADCTLTILVEYFESYLYFRLTLVNTYC